MWIFENVYMRKFGHLRMQKHGINGTLALNVLSKVYEVHPCGSGKFTTDWTT